MVEHDKQDDELDELDEIDEFIVVEVDEVDEYIQELDELDEIEVILQQIDYDEMLLQKQYETLEVLDDEVHELRNDEIQVDMVDEMMNLL